MALTEVFPTSRLGRSEATPETRAGGKIWTKKIEKATFRVEAQFSESVNAC